MCQKDICADFTGRLGSVVTHFQESGGSFYSGYCGTVFEYPLLPLGSTLGFSVVGSLVGQYVASVGE